MAIGAWVIDEACRQTAQWRQSLHLLEPLPISVNVSANQFSNGAALLHHIRQALETFALSPDALRVEITESAIMHSPDVATVTLMELRRMGIEVDLDDFGTGYSSLGYLQRFPVDTLKIDRSFISGPAGNEVSNPEIVQTIASLATSLSLNTTAEGIETAEQLDPSARFGLHARSRLFLLTSAERRRRGRVHSAPTREAAAVQRNSP